MTSPADAGFPREADTGKPVAKLRATEGIVMKRIASLLALALTGAPAFAQGPAPDAAPPAVHGSAATFTCGGVGADDAQAMKAQAGSHDLMLTFAESTGGYLADVDVQISDRRGRVVLSGVCAGPIMLADLPAGTWRVSAQVNGLVRQRTVTTAHGRTARATLVWPAESF
jgi:hypothetical protein